MIYKQDSSIDSSLNRTSRLSPAALPDIQNAPTGIKGAPVPIMRVGISKFRLPLHFKAADNKLLTLESTISGHVSLEANRKGIHMSRIMRSFYDYKEEQFTVDTLAKILETYKRELDSKQAHLKIQFNYPILQKSLKSELVGYQYYKCGYEATLDECNILRRFIHFNFEYSSACPCSTQLAEHSLAEKNISAIPHSQRSIASIKVELEDEKTLSIENLQEHCVQALQTETQVMVKREDEQKFAELNYEHQKFVEDAVRLVYKELNTDFDIADFSIKCTHYESLHSHNAVASLCKGIPGGFDLNEH